MQTKVCERCKEEFQTYKPNQRFCCYEHSNLARIKYKDKECPVCGKIFHPKNGVEICCCIKCAGVRKRTLSDRICPWCGKNFRPKCITQTYCSKKCYGFDSRLENIICPICNKEFKPKFIGTKYCSIKCRNISHRLSEEEKIERAIKNTAVCPKCHRKFIKKRDSQEYCSIECSQKSKGAKSKENKRFGKLLTQLGFEWVDEFHLGKYFYDFKIGDILIENNPYAYHSSTFAPKKPGVKPKEKLYHYNKYRCAIDNGYRCIMVWDWTVNLIEMITDRRFHYEGPPQLHYYNPKTKEHIITQNKNKSRIDKGFVEIRDCGKETF